MISTVEGSTRRAERPDGVWRASAQAARTVTVRLAGSAAGQVRVARAGLVVVSKTNSSRAGPVTPLSTGAVSAICPGLEGMSPCQPTHTMV